LLKIQRQQTDSSDYFKDAGMRANSSWELDLARVQIVQGNPYAYRSFEIALVLFPKKNLRASSL
jgi:hypothetical protein